MALIKCEECGNEISDKAAACPKCGAPVGNSVKEASMTGEEGKKPVVSQRGARLFLSGSLSSHC